MSQKQAYITLESIIQDYLTESEQGNNKFFKVFHLAFRGMEQLGINAFYDIKTQKFPVNANLTVALPADYLQWSKVGVLNEIGEVIPLYYNNKLTYYADLSADRISKTQDNSLWDWSPTTWVNYWNGNCYTNIYGVPSGQPFVGSFKIDNKNGVLLLDEKFAYNYIIMEYVSSPVVGEDYYVPMQFREALITWLWWKDKRAVNINKGQVGISRDLKNDFYNERRNAIAAWKPTRKYEKYQASQEMTRQAIKS